VNRAGCHDGPDAFAPCAAAFAACALRDETVDDDKSYCSFGGVVGGFGAGSGDELKVRFAVVDETVAHVLGGPGAGHALCAGGDDAAALFTHGSVEPGFARRFPPAKTKVSHAWDDRAVRRFFFCLFVSVSSAVSRYHSTAASRNWTSSSCTSPARAQGSQCVCSAR